MEFDDLDRSDSSIENLTDSFNKHKCGVVLESSGTPAEIADLAEKFRKDKNTPAESSAKKSAPEADEGTIMWALRKALESKCGVRRRGWFSAIFPQSSVVPLRLMLVSANGELRVDSSGYAWSFTMSDLAASDWELISESELKAINFKGQRPDVPKMRLSDALVKINQDRSLDLVARRSCWVSSRYLTCVSKGEAMREWTGVSLEDYTPTFHELTVEDWEVVPTPK